MKKKSKVIGGVAGAAGIATVFYLTLSPKAAFILEKEKLVILARPGVVQIWCLDVDQGSATLIITPSKQHAILIDAGDTGAGRNVIVPLFNALEEVNGVVPGRIDLMVVTHYDSDHIGGADEVLAALPVAELFDHGDHDYWLQQKPTAAMRDYHAAMQAQAIPLTFDRTVDGVRVQCFAANNRTRFDPPGEAFQRDSRDDNPNSVALLVSYGDFELYIAGDQTGETEERLVGHVPDVEVLHMNHHGSATHGSNHGAFLDALKPEVAIASNGQDAGYRHPHAAPVHHLLAKGTHVYLLNFNEHSEVRLDPEFIGDDEPKGKEGTFVVTVDTARKEYYVLLYKRPLDKATYPIEKTP